MRRRSTWQSLGRRQSRPGVSRLGIALVLDEHLRLTRARPPSPAPTRKILVCFRRMPAGGHSFSAARRFWWPASGPSTPAYLIVHSTWHVVSTELFGNAVVATAVPVWSITRPRRDPHLCDFHAAKSQAVKGASDGVRAPHPNRNKWEPQSLHCLLIKDGIMIASPLLAEWGP